MKPTKKIRLSALFLLVIFSMNPVVGFACSLGVDMGFNSGHHSHGGGKHHEHDSGKQHEHSDADHHHEHDGNKSHSHNHEAKPHHHSDITNNTVSFTSQSEDNCCNDLVADFQKLDKAIVKGNSNIQQPHFVLSPFIIPVVLGLNNTKGFTKHFRIPPKEIDLPPPDILVFIQSFLI